MSSSVHRSDRVARPTSALASPCFKVSGPSRLSWTGLAGGFLPRVHALPFCGVVAWVRQCGGCCGTDHGCSSALLTVVQLQVFRKAREGRAAVRNRQCCGHPVFIPHTKGGRCCSRDSESAVGAIRSVLSRAQGQFMSSSGPGPAEGVRALGMCFVQLQSQPRHLDHGAGARMPNTESENPNT